MDGGTRTASITGAYVALAMALNKMVAETRVSPRLDGGRRGRERRHRGRERVARPELFEKPQARPLVPATCSEEAQK